MHPLSHEDVTLYVEEHIGDFHFKRLKRLEGLKLEKILKRKNPYLFRAKNILTAQNLVQSLLDAYLSSQEETIFGDFLEGLAIFINAKVFGGRKSAAEGIDLEFQKDGIKYIVSIKSGPNWGNSSQIRRMVDNFKKAKKILRTSNSQMHIVAVNGCCYGIDNNPDKGEYFKYCGQRLWSFISGDNDLFIKIIRPLGYMAKQKNEQFQEEYARIMNKFTFEFGEKYCSNGVIDWKKLVEFNSAFTAP